VSVRRFRRWLAASALVCAAAPGWAAGDPLFESREPLSITLRGPLHSMARDAALEPAYRDGALAFTDGDGMAHELAVRLRPRGKSRRDREVCTFPPLRVDFPADAIAGTVFEGQDKLKLATYCRPPERHQRFIYKEYLACRMLNMLTDASFRVRPLEVDYVDLDRGGRAVRRFGYFLEDKTRMALRLGLDPTEPERVWPEQLEPEHASLMDLFEFMIGNTDFSFIALPVNKPCCHNAVLLSAGEGVYAPFPYDFDITGFVNPPYAVPDYRLQLANVRQRLFRGYCRPPEFQARAIERFREARPAVLEVLRTETALDPRSRDEAVSYIEGFYAILDDPRRLERQVTGACLRGPAGP
jgi:hypothetical protein